MNLTVNPILRSFGAEVSGVDIRAPLDEKTRAAIIEIQNTYGVTVWRDTGLNDETHIAFSRIFEQPRCGRSHHPGRARAPAQAR